MIIYRIENERGFGPYRCYTNWKCDENDHNDLNHPGAWEDNIIDKIYDIKEERHDFYCGFEKLYMLHNWFLYQELKNLKDIGYNIVEIEIDKKWVIFGKSKRQIMFKYSEIISKEIIK